MDFFCPWSFLQNQFLSSTVGFHFFHRIRRRIKKKVFVKLFNSLIRLKKELSCEKSNRDDCRLLKLSIPLKLSNGIEKKRFRVSFRKCKLSKPFCEFCLGLQDKLSPSYIQCVNLSVKLFFSEKKTWFSINFHSSLKWTSTF